MQNIGNGLTLGGSLIICIGIMSAFEIQKTIDTIRATQSEVISAEKKEALQSKDRKKATAALIAETKCKADLEKMIFLSFDKKNAVYSVFLTVSGTFLCGLAALL